MPASYSPAPVGADANLHGTYAGMISRGLSWIIDISIVSVASVAIFWILGATLAIFGVPTENCTEFIPVTDLDAIQHNLCRMMRAGEYFFALLLPPVYFTLFWWLGGQTIGMAIIGVRLIRANGRPITIATSLLRLVGYVVAIIPLGLGFLWALFDSRRQGWHDKLAGTYVIYWRIPRRRMQQYARLPASPAARMAGGAPQSAAARPAPPPVAAPAEPAAPPSPAPPQPPAAPHNLTAPSPHV